MPHTYVCCRLHIIFSTKGRARSIPDNLQPRLWQYITGICRKIGVKPFAVGGWTDHCHVLIGLPATLNIAEVVQKIKANSSRWMRSDGKCSAFQWQEAYSAFSVSVSHIDRTIEYIRNQKRHHSRRTFEEEWKAILRLHGIDPASVVPTGL